MVLIVKMVKKCVYCKAEIHDGRALDICNPCGMNVWGEKMFNAILKNTEDAKEKGDLSYSDPEEISKAA